MRRCGEICHSPGVDQASIPGVATVLDDSFEGNGTDIEASVGTGTAALATTLPSQALSAPDFRNLEDRILTQALETVDDSMKWAEIDPSIEEPPAEWVAELGEARARKRLRVAKAAWASAKFAPVGLGMARATALGIMKVRAAVKIGTPTLNVNFVSWPSHAQPVLDVIDLSGEEK